MTIPWRHQYADPLSPIERAAYANTEIDCTNDPGLTQQHHANDADLNTIAFRYGLTGKDIPNVQLDPSYFADFGEPLDLATALQRIRAAEDHFAALPAKLRAKFDNSPAQMWRWINNEDNLDEAVRLGLLVDKSSTASPGTGTAGPSSSAAPSQGTSSPLTP